MIKIKIKCVKHTAHSPSSKTTTTILRVLPLVHVEISLLCLLYPQWQAILQNS